MRKLERMRQVEAEDLRARIERGDPPARPLRLEREAEPAPPAVERPEELDVASLR